ncbi:helix-turn-helix transcriptional regulator [Nocardia amamiensis]|uniref:helix-turn-helix transcriptional regulator n=1 Tax=Nocardia amamiensis TaxID=404578 RepID=UPI0009FC983F|nr:AAA family ATPase [Nocardia amamiensis]
MTTSADAAAKLVGRTTELLSMQQVLSGALSGSADAVAVLGEPGIGKTCMLGELCERAGALGFDVLAGRGSEFEQDVPYGLVIDALDERFRTLEAEVIADLGPQNVAELGAILPSLAGRSGRLASQLQVERFEFHRAVGAAFERCVRDRPLVLAFDDVHWADPASVELIGFLLRRPVPGVVLALAYRPLQAPRRLLDAVAQAVRDDLLRELKLVPLTIGEASELLGHRPESAFVRSLHLESGGNPFYLEQLARMARNSSAPKAASQRDNEHETSIPAAVRATLAQELAVLSSSALEVLQAAAVVGDPFDVDLVTDTAATNHSTVLECLDALVTADLVRVCDVAGSFRFRHPIVRRVVYDSTMPGWRLGAHKRTAHALTRRGAALGARAHHIERSASIGDEEAVTILTEAGHAVAAHAPAAAAGWFKAALRLLPETGRVEQRLPLAFSLAIALASSGSLLETRATLEQVLELVPSSAHSDRIRVIVMIARTDHGLGRAEEARHLITTALEKAAPGSADAVALRLELAQNRLMMGRWEEAVDIATQARTQAEDLSEPTLLIAATSTLAWYTSYRGSVAEAQELIDLAADGLDAREIHLDPVLLDALADLMAAEMSADRFRAAGRHAERGVRASRATGNGYAFSRFTLGVAVSKLNLGQLNDARYAAETAVEAALLLQNDQLLQAAESLLCWVETLRGELPAAVAAGRAAVQAADRQPDAVFAWLAHACYGEALIEAGETERGRQEILSIGGFELSDVPPTNRTLVRQTLVTAELSVGRIDAAEKVVRQMEETSVGTSREGGANFARARIHHAVGDFTAAAAAAQKAAECFDMVELPIWAGRCQLLAGRSLGLDGQLAAAIHELERAHTIFHDTGAERLRDETAKELRNLGRRVRRQPAAIEPGHPPTLTERERGVADRIVQGYTNREIAAELFISPKTVEKHLARIFTKLGISSRAGVAAALYRHQTNQPGQIRGVPEL